MNRPTTDNSATHRDDASVIACPPAAEPRAGVVALLLLVLLAWGLWAQGAHAEVGGPQAQLRNVHFFTIGIDEGLSQAAVHSITQDGSGYIWLGTQEGLNRWDGYQMTVFSHDPATPGSLSHDWIWQAFVDREQRLWVATNGGGLNLYNSESQTFTALRHNPEDANSLAHDLTRVIFQDRQGYLWIGMDGGGLDRYDPDTGRFLHYRNNPADPGSLPSDTVLAITEDRAGDLWVGTAEGLARLDRPSGRFVRYLASDGADALGDDRVRAIYEDRDGDLWVGTQRGGLNLFDPRTGRFRHFEHDAADPASLSSDLVRDIYQDRDGTLWIATDNGLNEWRPEVQGFARYSRETVPTADIAEDRMTDLFQDEGGVLWVGTYNGANGWTYVSDAFNYPLDLAGKVVTSVAEDSRGRLWVGSYGEGLVRIDPATGESALYTQDPQEPTSLADNRIMAVAVDSRDHVWVGTRAGGLNRLDPVAGVVTRFGADPTRADSLPGEGVSSLHVTPTGDLWVGVYGGGIARLESDADGGRFTVYSHDPKAVASLSSNRVLFISTAGDGLLWVGTEDGGLNMFDPTDGTATHYRHDPDNPESLGSDTAWEVMEASDGSLWIGTLGGGLNRWDIRDRLAGRERFRRFRKTDGLRSDTVFGIVEDGNGFLWLSSNRGLTRFNPDDGSTRHFDGRNGLQGDEFNFGARLRARTGDLVFGGSDGLVYFHPGRIRFNDHRPPVVLSANTRDRLLATSSGVTSQEIIPLGYTDDYVAFEFAALDYVSPDKNQYLYKLEGFDGDWRDPGQFRRATYTNLPPGNYRFRVKAANNDGVWNDSGASLTLKVLPAPWKSPWAYALYTLIGGALVLAYVIAQRRKLEQEAERGAELEHQVQVRTQELEDRNLQLETLNAKLAEASVTDSLTGLWNRRYLDDFIEREVAQLRRQLETGSTTEMAPALFFMMIDLDGFKAINDTFGHHAGDRALLQVRDVLQECCRKSDTIIRWGGDEFLVVGRNNSPRALEILSERVREGLAQHQYQLGEGNVGRLSGSIGFATWPFAVRKPDVLSWEQVSTLADHAAYVAKQNGRNAWVGIYGTRETTPADFGLIRDELGRAVALRKVTMRTSLEGQLDFSDRVVERQS